MYKSYVDFLQDQRFLEWKIVDNDESKCYWENFKANNPELIPYMKEAETFLQNYKLNHEVLDEFHRTALLKKIISSNAKLKKRKKIIIFSGVAAIAILCILIGFFRPETTMRFTDEMSENIVVGSHLRDQDILFVSGNKTQSFQKNIQIEIDSKGKTIINSEDADAVLEVGEKATNKIIVPYGKRTNIQLSDGTKIWLNSGSELEFPSVFPREKREIKLVSGEMYIEVAPELKRRFYVHTADFKINVYGTMFNVSLYKNYPQTVILTQGEISLARSGQNEETIVYPNQKAVYHKNGKITKEKVNAQHYTSWKDGFIELYETPVTDIFDYIERYYNISFNYPRGRSLSEITCTGKLYLSENIDNVMNSIALLSSTTYEHRDGKIYIINNN